MRTRRNMLIICGLAIFLVVIAKLFMHMADSVVQERYASYSDAIDKDAHIHGMVPVFLPRSATQIIAERDLDSDTLKVEFVFKNDFDGFLSEQSKKSMILPIGILDRTSLSEVDIDRLQVISSPGSVQECTSHLVVDMQARKAVYIYNLAPHIAGCLEKTEELGSGP